MAELDDPPLLVATDMLLWLRDYGKQNPNDLPAKFVNYCAVNFQQSHSQLFQDLLVVFFLSGKRNGYFVEFGATDGVSLSNTVVLERQLEWKGILAEPAKVWHAALRANRRAAIDPRLVWSKSGDQLEFKETKVAELSTLSSLADKDGHKQKRTEGTCYMVDTVSLNDLLEAHKAPREIDYMSVDTEGSEFEILRSFDFDRYTIKIMTVEHNYCEPARQDIFNLLQSKGLVRLFEPLSKFDDWYVSRSVLGL